MCGETGNASGARARIGPRGQVHAGIVEPLEVLTSDSLILLMLPGLGVGQYLRGVTRRLEIRQKIGACGLAKNRVRRIWGSVA